VIILDTGEIINLIIAITGTLSSLGTVFVFFIHIGTYRARFKPHLIITKKEQADYRYVIANVGNGPALENKVKFKTDIGNGIKEDLPDLPENFYCEVDLTNQVINNAKIEEIKIIRCKSIRTFKRRRKRKITKMNIVGKIRKIEEI
jgi:hypothetical protein